MFAGSFLKFLSKENPGKRGEYNPVLASLERLQTKKGICSVPHCLHFCDFMNESLPPGLSSVTAGFLFTALHIPMPEQGNMAHASADLAPEEAPQLASTSTAHICQSRFFLCQQARGALGGIDRKSVV